MINWIIIAPEIDVTRLETLFDKVRLNTYYYPVGLKHNLLAILCWRAGFGQGQTRPIECILITLAKFNFCLLSYFKKGFKDRFKRFEEKCVSFTA